MNAVKSLDQPPQNRICLLGGLRIVYQNEPVHLNGRNLQTLFTYLLLNHQPQPREIIAETLWPNLPASRARRNVSDTLYRLRQQLPANWFLVEQAQIGLHPQANLWLDVAEFQQHLQQQKITGWETAVSLYNGDLLPELYDDWLLEKRLALREQFLTALHQLGQAYERQNQQAQAYQQYTRLLQEDELREEAYRGAMRTLAQLGRLREAVDLYDQLEQLLHTQLAVAPTAQTHLLVQRLQKELALHTAVQQTSHQQTPFVGRIHERSQLLARLDKAHTGQGGITVVLGDAGMGKSRLLVELAQAADWRGWQVAWGYGQEFATLPPYTPLRQALTAALPAPRLEQLAKMIRPLTLSLAAHVIPSIAEHLDLPDDTQISSQQEQIPLAVGRLLDGLQTIAPHLLILEDVHWSDTAVWALLEALRPSLHEMSILIVISGRLDELRNQSAAWEQLQAWDRYGETILPLKGLATNELAQLVDETRATPLPADQLTAIQQASGGNPLFALHLLEAEDRADGEQETATLNSLTTRRITAVSQPAQLALQAAAILGYRFQYPLWETLVKKIDAAQLPMLAGELEQAHLILLDTNSYRFAHDTLRATVYRAIPDSRRQQLHADAFHLIQQTNPDQTHTLLYHAEQAGLTSQIAAYALQVGEQALRSYSYEAAFDHFTQTLSLLPEDAWAERYRALYGRIQAADILARREPQKADLTQLQAAAARLDDSTKLAEAALLNGRFLLATGDHDTAVQVVQAGLNLAANPHLQADLSLLLGQTVRQLGQYGRAREYVLRARDLYHAQNLTTGEAQSTDLLGGLAWSMGDYATAIENHAAAAHLSHTTGNIFHEALALNNLGSAYWGAGDYANSEKTLQQTLALNRELGHKRGEADNLDNLGGIAWSLADYETAVSFYNQALAIRRQIADNWGISISLGNLGGTYRLLGDYETALDYLAEALAVNRQMGRRSGEGYNLHYRGLTYLDMGRLDEAHEALTASLAIREELAQQDNQLETLAGLALVYRAQKNNAAAQKMIERTLSQLTDQQRASLRQWVHFATYQVLADVKHLALAEKAMQEIAQTLPPDDRVRFLQRHPLNQQVQTAVTKHTQQIEQKVVRSDTPLGRKLVDEDYTAVIWTISAPEDELIEDRVDRRHHALQRLLNQADAQNAAPTDDDLAQALNVSRRTILRDSKTLADAGIPLPTRRRTA